jgi:hypothetical protein
LFDVIHLRATKRKILASSDIVTSAATAATFAATAVVTTTLKSSSGRRRGRPGAPARYVDDNEADEVSDDANEGGAALLVNPGATFSGLTLAQGSTGPGGPTGAAVAAVLPKLTSLAAIPAVGTILYRLISAN